LPFGGYTRTPRERRVSGGYKEDHNFPEYYKISIYQSTSSDRNEGKPLPPAFLNREGIEAPDTDSC
jgi:hypothetical protein